MVSLFAQALSPEMVYTFFDFFFLEGITCLYKGALFIMFTMQNIIFEQNNLCEFEYIFNMFNEAPSHIHSPRNFIYFLSEKKFEIYEKDIKLYTEKLKPLYKNHSLKRARANIFACAGWLASCGSCEGSCVRSADTYRNAHHIVAVQADFCEVVFYTEFQKLIRRRGNRPTISVVMLYH